MAEDREGNRKEAARKARDERLAAALRANLRRRKALSRAGPESVPVKPLGEKGAPCSDRK